MHGSLTAAPRPTLAERVRSNVLPAGGFAFEKSPCSVLANTSLDNRQEEEVFFQGGKKKPRNRKPTKKKVHTHMHHQVEEMKMMQERMRATITEMMHQMSG